MCQNDDVGSGSPGGFGGWKLRRALDRGARQDSDGPREVGGFG